MTWAAVALGVVLVVLAARERDGLTRVCLLVTGLALVLFG